MNGWRRLAILRCEQLRYGSWRMWFRVFLVGCLGLMACEANTPSLRARSAGDLHCPAEVLKIYQLDDRAYRVVGCEQEVVYISVCIGPRSAMNTDCTWHVDSTRSNAAAKQPAKQATSDGCSFDTQCKGDRVCVNKQCVAPPTPAPASSRAAD